MMHQPCELACYSRVEGGDVFFDDRSLVSLQTLVSLVSFSLFLSIDFSNKMVVSYWLLADLHDFIVHY